MEETYEVCPICGEKIYYTQSTTIDFETNDIVKTKTLKPHICKPKEYGLKEKLEFYRNLLDEVLYTVIDDGYDYDDKLKIIEHMGDRKHFPDSFDRAGI